MVTDSRTRYFATLTLVDGHEIKRGQMKTKAGPKPYANFMASIKFSNRQTMPRKLVMAKGRAYDAIRDHLDRGEPFSVIGHFDASLSGEGTVFTIDTTPEMSRQKAQAKRAAVAANDNAEPAADAA